MELPAISNGSATDTDTGQPDATHDLDVREVPKPQRHPLIFARFDALAVGESFVLVNSHDPKHLRQEFDRDHPGTYDWQYLESGRADAVDAAGSGRGAWRIQITRLIDGDLPRLVGDIHVLTNADTAAASDSVGAVWKLDVATRQLDANVIQLRPGGRIEAHTGPELDVIAHVLGGSGQLRYGSGHHRVGRRCAGVAAAPLASRHHRRRRWTVLSQRAFSTPRVERRTCSRLTEPDARLRSAGTSVQSGRPRSSFDMASHGHDVPSRQRSCIAAWVATSPAPRWACRGTSSTSAPPRSLH